MHGMELDLLSIIFTIILSAAGVVGGIAGIGVKIGILKARITSSEQDVIKLEVRLDGLDDFRMKTLQTQSEMIAHQENIAVRMGRIEEKLDRLVEK